MEKTLLSDQQIVLFLGPDKSGSTWCYDYGSQHRDVHVARAKDLFFLNDDKTYERGLEWYLRQFEAPRKEVLFDVGHDYLFSEKAAQRVGEIREMITQVQTVVCVRDPLERAFSSYRYMLRQGRLTCGFEEAILTVDELVEHGQYGRWCELWAEESGELPARLDFALLRQDEEKFAAELCAVLDVPLSSAVDLGELKKNGAVEARNPRVVSALRRVLAELRRVGLHHVAGAAKEFALESGLLFKPAQKSQPTAKERQVFWDAYGDDAQRLDTLYGTNYSDLWGAQELVS